ncbi:hypothetical protein KQX54_001662 [Cotesia glomerata]|uniref:Uncharacterized protein n=1 Tax=Cotesia glomerata TaxID=32391 RepID=A0AAV7IP05_COTGL|nr:hypothetical protein KQX54_001662 [Cotesia glomerata]
MVLDLEKEISYLEIEKCLGKLKTGKSPGPDNFSNEFFKNMPTNWKWCLQTLFNIIFDRGIILSSSALSLKVAENSVKKAKIAMSTVISILSKAKKDSWDACNKLFDALSISTLLYGFPVWEIPYKDQLEIAKNELYRKILKLPKNTPISGLRLELGLTKLKCRALAKRLLQEADSCHLWGIWDPELWKKHSKEVFKKHEIKLRCEDHLTR